MKTFTRILVAAALAVTPLASAAADATTSTPTVPAQLGANEVLPICDKALLAMMNGQDPVAVLNAETKDLDTAAAGKVKSFCAAFLLGAIALHNHQTEAAQLPAGDAKPI